MSEIQLVEEIDDLIKINHVFASTTDKSGLIANKRKDGKIIKGLPENGLVGLLFKINPNVVIISTGGTAKLIAEAGYKVTEISDYTGWPEMVTGLVKSMHPKLYVGMLAHNYTKSDVEYMKLHNIPSIDMVLVNFYAFEETVDNNPLDFNPEAFEIIRQNMDVGGPTAAHTSRKGFLTTAVATRQEDYVIFANDLIKHNGQISLKSRIKAMKNCSEDLYNYFKSINDFLQKITIKEIKRSYKTINNPAKGVD